VYRKNIEDPLKSCNTRQVWQSVQHNTSYNSSNYLAAEGDALLREELNLFFALF